MYLGWLIAAFLPTPWQWASGDRRWASPVADCYAVYALLNVVVYMTIHPLPKHQREVMFAVVYETIAERTLLRGLTLDEQVFFLDALESVGSQAKRSGGFGAFREF